MLRPLFIILLVLTGTLNCFPQTTDLQRLLAELQELSKAPEQLAEVNGKIDTIRAELDATDIKELAMRLEILEKSAESIYPKAVAMAENLGARVTELENRKPSEPVSNPYTFVLHDENGDGDVDEEWEAIIAKGQEIQKPYWEKSEKGWMEKLGSSPSGAGWFGTAESPVITILCDEPVYYFHNTARLPGRFTVTCSARWGTFLRFLGDGDKVLVDNNGWGTQTNAPIGIYVEPSTKVNGREIKSFEQTITNVMIVAQNGTMPVYLAEAPFNLQISDCNIQYHGGAAIGVKHGPALIPKDWSYPVEQISANVYLPDPKFINIQIEGRHRFERKACGFLVAGNNMIFQNINFYGILHGIYGMGQGIVVDGCTLHHGDTADGRSWAGKDQFVLCLLTSTAGQNPNSISGVAGPVKTWNLTKWSVVPSAGGWHNAGERCL